MMTEFPDISRIEGLRAFVPGDLQAMLDIYNETASTGRNSPISGPLDLARFERIVEDIQQTKGTICVLEQQHEIIALVWISRFVWGGEASRLTGELAVYIRKDHRSQGLGKQLVLYAPFLARAAGYTTLVAWVLAENAASNGVLQSLGFARWGYLPGILSLGPVKSDVALYGVSLEHVPTP